MEYFLHGEVRQRFQPLMREFKEMSCGGNVGTKTTQHYAKGHERKARSRVLRPTPKSAATSRRLSPASINLRQWAICSRDNFGLRPNLTPLAFAASMPARVRSVMVDLSSSAKIPIICHKRGERLFGAKNCMALLSIFDSPPVFLGTEGHRLCAPDLISGA